MGVYAYLRVSTDEQDVDNQRHGILEYANSHNLGGLQFVPRVVWWIAVIVLYFQRIKR